MRTRRASEGGQVPPSLAHRFVSLFPAAVIWSSTEGHDCSLTNVCLFVYLSFVGGNYSVGPWLVSVEANRRNATHSTGPRRAADRRTREKMGSFCRIGPWGATAGADRGR
jgi:hypothetical protein